MPIALIAIVMVAIVSPAHAYDEIPPVNPDCIDCHGTAAGTEPAGPHGGYLTTTNKCVTCHTVHRAPAGGTILLPAATIKGTCDFCHDGTGGKGVYGVLAAKIPAVTVAAAHRIDTTNVVPGGSSGGGSATGDFSGITTDYLTCSDCHSPHGANVVAAFTGDRARSTDDAGGLGNVVVSSRLLRKRPVTATGDVTVYGSDWCAGCHKGRLSGSGMASNHPVESSVNLPPGGAASMHYYQYVAKVTTADVSTTTKGTLGKSNYGYVMPDPRTADQTGHDPICQQCHEDARSVGNVHPQQVDSTEVFTLTALDGAVTGDNPRFQTFPHESPNTFFLVELNDSLCLNCHAPPP
ncbi:MAG: hypothetical protein EG823_03515 [Actinobacteria bacterium]|nr:hypothetical protein [Actinomycetota bacterium]